MNNSFLHINSTNCNWKVGDELSFEKEDNNYWKSFLRKEDSYNFQGNKHDAFKVLHSAFEAYARLHNPPLVMKEYHFNQINTLKESLDCLRNTILINRELIFESVRNEFFPNLPSRQKCIWLIPNNDDSLDFWINILKSKGSHHKLFRIETVNGTIHKATQQWLEGGTISINQWQHMATNYWKGVNSGKIDDEILYQGRIKILEEITIPTLKKDNT